MQNDLCLLKNHGKMGHMTSAKDLFCRSRVVCEFLRTILKFTHFQQIQLKYYL